MADERGDVDGAPDDAGALGSAAPPNLAEAHVLRGRLLVEKRQLPEAATEYREAIRLRPDFARIRLDLASVLAAHGNLSKLSSNCGKHRKATTRKSPA